MAFDLGVFISSPEQWFTAKAFIIYFVLGAVASAIAIALIVVKKIMPIASFAYPVTRTRAMKGQMIKEKKLRELTESYSYKDVIAAFEGTSYEKEVASKQDIEEIEHALTMNLAKDYNKIVSMSPPRAEPFFKLLGTRYSVKNIKSILTAKETNESSRANFPCPMSDALLQKLTDAPSTQETIELLKLTELEKAIENLPNTADLDEIKKALDKHLFEKVFSKKKIKELAAKAGVMQDSTHLLKLFGYFIDLLNIKIALRAVNSKLNEKEAKELLIKNNFFVSEKDLETAIQANDVQSAIGTLEGTPYYSVLSEAVRDYSKERGLYRIEKRLDKFYSEQVKACYLAQAFGLTPLGAYLLLKEDEIRTLKGILNGIQEDIPKEKIKEMIIGA